MAEEKVLTAEFLYGFFKKVTFQCIRSWHAFRDVRSICYIKLADTTSRRRVGRRIPPPGRRRTHARMDGQPANITPLVPHIGRAEA